MFRRKSKKEYLEEMDKMDGKRLCLFYRSGEEDAGG